MTDIPNRFYGGKSFELPEAVSRGCSVKKGVPKNFAKFTGKHLCQSLFFRPQASNFIEKRLWLNSFPVHFEKFLETSFSQNTSGGSFLNS